MLTASRFLRLHFGAPSPTSTTGSVGCSRRVVASPTASGRRSAHLLARQEELRTFLLQCGLPTTPYPVRSPAKGFAPHRPGGPPELRPCRDADVDRLAITGRGHWDSAPFLEPELLMPFLEPSVLRGICARDDPFPDTSRDKPEEVVKLCRLWDSLGSLAIAPRESCAGFSVLLRVPLVIG